MQKAELNELERKKTKVEMDARVSHYTVDIHSSSSSPSPSSLSELQAIMRAHRCFSRHGFCILEGSSFPTDFMDSLADAAFAIEKKISLQLRALGIVFSEDTLSSGKHMTKTQRTELVNMAELKCNFKFKEVSSRCFGRLDIRYEVQCPLTPCD